MLSTRTSIKSMEEWIQYLQREIEIWNSTALLVKIEKHITFASYSSKILQPAPVRVIFLLTDLFFVLMELLGACKCCLPDPTRPSTKSHILLAAPHRLNGSKTLSYLKSLFVTGYLSIANGFTVTSLTGPSSFLFSGELDPIWNVPPGSCTMFSSFPYAKRVK